jgi:hypothetical protein
VKKYASGDKTLELIKPSSVPSSQQVEDKHSEGSELSQTSDIEPMEDDDAPEVEESKTE